MIDHLEQDPILVVDNLKLAYGDYLVLENVSQKKVNVSLSWVLVVAVRALFSSQ